MQTYLRAHKEARLLALALFVTLDVLGGLLALTIYLTGSYALLTAGNAGQIVWVMANSLFIAFLIITFSRRAAAKAPK